MFTKADIEKYFIAEKKMAQLFAILGIAAFVIAIGFFFFMKTNFYKGAAIPLVLVSILMIVAGLTVYKRSDGDRQRNVYAYDLNPSELKEKELPRMKIVMKNFSRLLYGEIAIAAIGCFLFFYFKSDESKQFWKGFGVSLFILAVILLLADSIASARGKKYTSGIDSFIQGKV